MRIGNHEISLEDEHLVTVRIVGDLSEREAQALCEALASLTQGLRGVLFLIDVRRGGELDARARRRILEGLSPIPSGGTAFVGASFRLRLVLQMIGHAARLLLGRNNPVVYVDTEEQARAWAAALLRERAACPEGAALRWRGEEGWRPDVEPGGPYRGG